MCLDATVICRHLKKQYQLPTTYGNYVWIFRIFATCWFSLNLFAGTFQATLERSQISVGETASLQATLQDDDPKSNPSLPQVAGLTFRPAGTSQRMSIVNGRSNHSHIFAFSITAAREGIYTIPAISIRAENKVLSTQPVTLTVTKGEPINANGQLAFARVAITKKEIFLGEIIPAELQFFVTEGRNLQGPQIKGDGFVVNKILPPTQSKVQINNMIYNMLIYKVAITPTKVGRINFGPVEFGIEVRQSGRRAANDPIAEFFGGGANYQEITILSDTVTINVLPLPVAPPGIGFLGAIGQFSMQVKAGPVALAVGDPITLKIDIQGKGSLDSMALPKLSWEHFKSYPATSSIQISDTLGIEGVKSFEQVVIPEGVEARSVPEIRFSYFDPERRSYVTMTNSSIAITVVPSGQPTAQATVVQSRSDEAVQPVASDLKHIKPDLGRISVVRPLLIDQPWFWASTTLPCLAWLGFFIWFNKKEQQRNDPRFQRKRRTQLLIQGGLIELRGAAEELDHIRFYTQAFRLLQEHIGDLLDLPSQSITETTLENPRIRLDEETQVQTELKELFHLCNLARYAGSRNEGSLSEVLSRLESIFGTTPGKKHGTTSSLSSLLLFWMLGVTIPVIADQSPLTAQFAEANRSYEQGNIQQSFQQYQNIRTNGASPALLFNLANAAWKSGRQGLAILSLAEAAQLTPHDSDIKTNLKFLRQRITRPPDTIAETLASSFNPNEVALLFWAGNGVLFGVLIYRKGSKLNHRSLPLYLAVTFFTIASVLLILSTTVRNTRVVVVVKEAAAKYGPVDESKPAFTARDGTELKLLENREQWFHVADAGNRVGWVKKTDVAILP